MNADVENFVNYINETNQKSGPETNQKSAPKRNRDKLSSDDIIGDIKLSALKRLREASSSDLKFKGLKLTNHISYLRESFEQITIGLRKDKQIKDQIPEFVRLWLVAEFSVCVNILDEIYAYSNKYKSKTFSDCITFMTKKIQKEHTKTNGNKKFKPDPSNISNMITLCIEDENKNNKDNKNSKNSKNRKNSKNKDDDDGNDDDDDEEYEEDSEADTSDDEEYMDDEDEDYEDEDYDIYYNEEEMDDSKSKHPIFNKKNGRDFIHQIFKSRDDGEEEEILKYYTNLTDNERNQALERIKEINSYQAGDKPILFQIMELSLPISQKNHILKNYTTLATSRHPDNKLKTWFDALMTIPFGKYEGVSLDYKNMKVKKFLDDLQTIMDQAVYGHDEAKRQIIQMMGQQIRNPQSKGNVLGIWGPPGNGKTSLVKEGIAKAMKKPFVFISLGGGHDASFLEGHSYTYEGSIYGRIVNGLITSKCMDPIIYFDELDKISKTSRGEEIANLLVHLTDPVQNSHFRDKYFHGIDIDLSRATIIFSYNDPSNVNHVLMDRITNVETKYLMINQKIHIAQNYLLPEMMKEMGLNNDAIVIDKDVIKEIIDKYTYEGGVRKLKSTLYSICREINLANLIKGSIGDDKDKVTFPFIVKPSHVKTLLKHKMEIDHDKIHTEDKPGIVNGLWANSLGNGGVLSIETMLVPSSSFLSVKATGHLEKVIKESTEVATSLAWNKLPKRLKDKYFAESKEKPLGIHIHCPDGATPKDGPSAGAALTIALYSLLTGKAIKHNIAMTGEINLEGKVTAIGGLEEKLEGAKRAGVKLVLFPKENVKHLEKIKERNKELLSNDFEVIPVETFEEVMKYSLVP
jgi:endopeptidase La